MKISITFSDNLPVIAIGSLQGVVMNLWGRTEYIVSKDPVNDTLSTWFTFFIAQKNNQWKFDYRSNCKYSDEQGQSILNGLVNKANLAIAEGQATDLSPEFNALNIREPYSFGGLFSRMNEHYHPSFEIREQDQLIVKMREEIRSSLSSDEIESDEHLRSFVLQVPLEIIWVDGSRGQ